jgi:hypothetical protein
VIAHYEQVLPLWGGRGFRERQICTRKLSQTSHFAGRQKGIDMGALSEIPETMLYLVAVILD